MRRELPDVRAIIAEQDQLERPALIIIDANGIGIGVYQDLWNGGLKHVTKTQNLYQAKTSQLKAQTFHHGLRHLYDFAHFSAPFVLRASAASILD